MAKIITSFASADGKAFDTELAADAHDLALSQVASVAAYAVAAKLGKAEATRAAKHVAGYAAFMVTYVAPEAVETAAVETAAA